MKFLSRLFNHQPAVEEPETETTIDMEECESRDVGSICVLIHLYGKEEPVKATFVGKFYSSGFIISPEEMFEEAIKGKFIKTDFGTYYPTADIAKIDIESPSIFNLIDSGLTN